MSREIEAEVWRYSNAKAAPLLTLLCIANDAANATREAVIPVSELVRLTRLAQRSVYYNLNKLEEMGEIVVIGDKHHPAAFRIRQYVGSSGYLKGQQLNVYEEHHPQPGNIKDAERQRTLQVRRPQPKRRRK